MSRPKLSIITTVHNIPDNYLERCMSSVIGQTFEDFEYIVICDNTTESNKRVVEVFIETDSRVRMYETPGIGYGSAFNLGLMYARGEFIGIVDGDDFVDPSFYSKLLVPARTTGCPVIKGNCMLYKDNKPVKPLDITKDVSGENYKFTWQQWSAIYNRLFILQNGIIMYPNTLKNNETLFLVKIGVETSIIPTVSDTYYNYCRRPGSLDNDYLDTMQIATAFNVRLDVIKYLLQVRAVVSAKHMVWVLQENISRALIESSRIKKDDKEARTMAAGRIGLLVSEVTDHVKDIQILKSVKEEIEKRFPDLQWSRIGDFPYLDNWIYCRPYEPAV